MNIPENGRIVVIDDQETEAVPLVRALSQKGYATTYFTEKFEELPSSPLPGVRLAFLDIVLGTDAQDERGKVTTAAKILEKVIDKNNGPFILVAWAKHSEYITELSRFLESEGYQFVLIDLEKSDCKDNGNYSIEIIGEKLKEKLDGKDALNLFIVWQNLVHRSAGKIVNDFSKLYPHDADWNKNMANVFFHLAVGYAGEHVDKTNHDDVIKNALFSFNGAFLDSLAAEIRKNSYSSMVELPFNDVTASPNIETLGKLNSKLIITDSSGNATMPGNIFENIDIPKAELKELFDGNFEASSNKQTLESATKYIFLEITPICDYAQKKQKVARLLPGVLWPANISNDKIDSSWYVYKSPVIVFQDNLYYMVFDFRYLTSLPTEKMNNKTPLFVIRQEMLVDIQSRLASHTSRPGFVSVNKTTFS